MKKTIALMLTILMIVPLFSGCDRGSKATPIEPVEGEAILYVAPDGDDTADGTFDAPLATLNGAAAKVRALLPDADGAVSVYFRGGDYMMTESVSFTEADSGKDGAPVKYAAYPGETVRFIGGVKVDPSLITPADPASSVVSRVTDETAKAALLQADVSSLVDVYPEIYSSATEENDSFKAMELYLGETAIEPARWPNYVDRTSKDNYVNLGGIEGKDRIYDYGDPDHIATLYYAEDVAERAATWSEESIADAHLYGILEFSWITDLYKVMALDREAGTISLSGGTNLFYNHTEAGPAAFLNIPEELDLPGESYVDRAAKIAYFYPTEDYDANAVILSTLVDDMIVMNGASNITFDGLTFGWTRGNVFMTEGCSDLTIENCRLVHTSAKAAYFYDAKNIHFDACEIGDTAHGGLVFSGGDRNTLESSGIVVENCDIHHFNRDGLTYSADLDNFYYGGGTPYTPGLSIYAVGALISHNKIHDCVHQAIFPESNDIVIEYNEIYNCVTECSDMGAIYYWNNPTLLGLVIRGNYFHDIGNTLSGGGQFSIYTDCGSMGPDIYDNLFVNAAGVGREEDVIPRPKAPILLAQFAHIHNNVFVNAQAGFRYGDWSLGTGRRQSDWIMYLYNRGTYGGTGAPDRFREVDFESEAWHNKYEGTIWGNIFNYFSYEKLAEFDAGGTDQQLKNKAAGMAPFQTNEIDNNVFVNVGQFVNSENDLSLNGHDNLMTEDLSLFADADNGDYSFTDSALAAIAESCPDFHVLPLDQIGPQQ